MLLFQFHSVAKRVAGLVLVAVVEVKVGVAEATM